MARSYEAHIADVSERQAERVKGGQCLPPIPPPADKDRRDSCEFDLLKFIRTYAATRCVWEFGEPHLEEIAKIQDSALNGGLFAIAMQRGGGKTTIAIEGARWAMSYGHQQYIVMIGSTQELAVSNLMDALKSAIMNDEEWAADFPELSVPFIALEGEARRCGGQRDKDGEKTLIHWGSDKIVSARVGYPTDEIVVSAHGLTGSFHGLRYARSDGTIIRPSFALIDDPQTMESAASAAQSAKRIRLIHSGILGLAGPGVRMAAVIACTKMKTNCLSSQLLDRNLHPRWRGKTYKMLEPMPDRMDLWSQYAEVRAERLRDDGPRTVEDDFLKANLAEMEAGAALSWNERVTEGDMSALQTAMNYWADDPDMFASEMQNEPLGHNIEAGGITREILIRQIGGYARGTAPIEATGCVASIDCHDNLLFWMLLWYNADSFTCGISDYGTWPGLGSRNFTRGRTSDDMVTEAAKLGIAGPEGIMRHALQQLMPIMLNGGAIRSDGLKLPVVSLATDAGWRKETVYGAIQDFGLGKTLGVFGRGITAKQRPLNDAVKAARRGRRGRKTGDNLYTDRLRGEPEHMVMDTNYWKSFLSSRLQTPQGASGALSIYKESPSHHHLLFDHATMERPKTVATEERSIEEWSELPGRTENHWFDCLDYCLAAASNQGAHLDGAAKYIPIAVPQEQQHQVHKVHSQSGGFGTLTR